MAETVIRRKEKQQIHSTVVPGVGDLDEGMDAIPDEEEHEDDAFEASADEEIEDEDEEDGEMEIEVTASPEIEDEDDEDEVEPSRPTRARPSRARELASRARSRSRSRARGTPTFSKEISENLENILASVDYEPGRHKISVYRVEPEFHPDTGRRIAGLCETFKREVTLDEIQKKFGGGRYKLLITGPRSDTGRGSQLKTSFETEIVGDPIVPMTESQKKLEDKKKQQEQEALLDRVLDRSDRRDEQAKQEMRDMQNQMVRMMEKAFERPKEDPQSGMLTVMTPIMTMMKEETARRDREARDQREREEQRRRDDEQRRREEREAAERKHESEMRRQEQQFAMQMKQLELQQNAVKEQMRVESENSKNQMQMMLQFMQKTEKEKESHAREQTQLQMQVMGQLSEIQKESMGMQLKLLTEQLKDAKTKDDFLETMAKYEQINRMLNPGEPEKDTWEKVFDRVGEVVPGVVTGLSALRGQPQQQQHGFPQPPGVQPGRMLPGSVAVVENVDYTQDEMMHGQPVGQHPSAMGGVPHAPQLGAPIPFHEVDMEAKKREAAGAHAQQETAVTVNDLTDFAPYPDQGSNEENMLLLVKNLDLAMQRGLDEDAMYAKCLLTLPEGQKKFLKMLPAATLISFIEMNVPASWALRSIDGEVKLRALHEKLVTTA